MEVIAILGITAVFVLLYHLTVLDLRQDREMLRILREYSKASDTALSRYVFNDSDDKDFSKALEYLQEQYEKIVETVPERLRCIGKRDKILCQLSDTHNGWVITLKYRSKK